jgi:hypothetical protein
VDPARAVTDHVPLVRNVYRYDAVARRFARTLLLVTLRQAPELYFHTVKVTTGSGRPETHGATVAVNVTARPRVTDL